MTEEQRVGQLFMLGLGGSGIAADERTAIRTYHLGSVWLYNPRTGGRASVLSLSRLVQAEATVETTAGVRFFVGVDQEGGQIQRLSGSGFSTIPPATQQGMLSAGTLQADAATWGGELRAAGINLNFAPVMDVVPPGADATNEPIGALQREYGHDPATVGTAGSAVVRGMAAAGVATTLKHFPGLGRVTGNTDLASGIVDPVTTADDPYLGSFRAGLAAGAPFVMISLATYPKIDPDHQAVFSRIVIDDVLRARLGFGGVVASDDLGMSAAVSAVPAGDRAVDFVSAGGDLIVARGVPAVVAMARALDDRAASDAAFRALVDGAALRVLETKAAHGLLTCGS